MVVHIYYNFSYKVNIEGMTCSHCKRTVENSFNEKEESSANKQDDNQLQNKGINDVDKNKDNK